MPGAPLPLDDIAGGRAYGDSHDGDNGGLYDLRVGATTLAESWDMAVEDTEAAIRWVRDNVLAMGSKVGGDMLANLGSGDRMLPAGGGHGGLIDGGAAGCSSVVGFCHAVA